MCIRDSSSFVSIGSFSVFLEKVPPCTPTSYSASCSLVLLFGLPRIPLRKPAYTPSCFLIGDFCSHQFLALGSATSCLSMLAPTVINRFGYCSTVTFFFLSSWQLHRLIGSTPAVVLTICYGHNSSWRCSCYLARHPLFLTLFWSTCYISLLMCATLCIAKCTTLEDVSRWHTIVLLI